MYGDLDVKNKRATSTPLSFGGEREKVALMALHYPSWQPTLSGTSPRTLAPIPPVADGLGVSTMSGPAGDAEQSYPPR